MSGDAGALASFPTEVVGVVHDRPQFERVVAALLDAGFARADLSVLSSHESLEASGERTPWRDAMLALLGDARTESALEASGAIFLAGGPLAAALAAVIGAAMGGVAARDVLTEFTAQPHTEAFAQALGEGRLVLWAFAADRARLDRALAIFEALGLGEVHLAPPRSHGDAPAR